MKFTVQQKNLKAVALAMATTDIRYYLNGVKLEFNGQEARLIATDGHRLHMVIEDRGGELNEPVSFIVPADMVKACCKAKAPKGRQIVEIEFSIDGQRIEAALPDGSTISNTALDGRFPDYCRVIPGESSYECSPSFYNPDYIVDAVQGLREYLEIGKKSFPAVGFAQRGSASGVLSVPGFTAIVMPMRADATRSADLRMTRPIAAPQKEEATA